MRVAGDVTGLIAEYERVPVVNERRRRRLIFNLGRSGDPAALQVVSRALIDDDSALVREFAARSIANAGAAEFADQLVAATGDQSPKVRYRAVKALVATDARVRVDRVTPLLNDTSSGVRSATARYLGHTLDTDAVPDLIGRLEDSDWSVRASSARALALIGDARAIEPLRKLQIHSRFLARRRIRQYINHLVHDVPPEEVLRR